MKKIAVLFVILSLAGCKKHHDKAWYDAHETERKEIIEKCKQDAATVISPDCQNAIDSSAFSDKGYKKFNPVEGMN